ncbi:GNAT family N-acetyltransferase [Lysobacter sp. Root690]|uniref:GNAT family N-acetyltransferase n=1 Tax=Lysobacter sp. Root690 TaxID=1736588 RepID=UPI0012F7B3CC|nr:GNAT family N-acetyltransferase [Lysobacter sp. Root690]
MNRGIRPIISLPHSRQTCASPPWPTPLRKAVRMNTPSLFVRPSTPQDEPQLLAILERTFEDTWRPQLTDAAIAAYRNDRVAERFVAEHGAAFFVAQIDDWIAGFAHRDGGFVDALHVLPRARRRGVGRLLMDAVEAAMRADGVTLAALETDTFNEGSQGLYLALGYVEVARYPDEEWNSGLITIRYEKSLAP